MKTDVKEMLASIRHYRFKKSEIEMFLKDMNDDGSDEIVIPVFESRRLDIGVKVGE